MKSAKEVDALVSKWKADGMTKAQIVVNTCEAELGWPYVWGASGQECNPSKREYYAGRSSCPDGEKTQIKKRCQVLNGSKSSCKGCTYYPDEQRVLIDDCQGFDKQIMKRIGITLTGGGATSMYNNNSNWSEKGAIQNMPDVVCCVFMKDGSTMKHTGIHTGGGNIIHCSGTVKRGKTSDKGWTNYAIPKGLGDPLAYPTIRKGSTGDYVEIAQEELQKRGYDIGSAGVDGKFGSGTQAAVMAFQRDWGLTVDGIVGPATWRMLLSAPVIEHYRVTIPGLSKDEAQALLNKYPDATIDKEGVMT